jgi:hypothetical protein
MGRRYGARLKRIDFARRFGLPISAFVLTAIVLGNALVQIKEEQRIAKTIEAIFTSELATSPAAFLDRMEYDVEDNQAEVMAIIHTPTMMRPMKVSQIQQMISRQIGMPTKLVVQCVIGNNVSALGSVKTVFAPQLEGSFIKSSDNPVLRKIAIAEQVIRGYLASSMTMTLERVEHVPMANHDVLTAHLIGVRELAPEEVGLLESRIRKATDNDTIELNISTIHKSLISGDGAVRYGWILGDKATAETHARIRLIREELSAIFEGDRDFELVNVNVNELEGKLQFLLEITGPQVYSRRRLAELEAHLSRKFAEPVVLYSWSRVEVVSGPEGRMSLQELDRRFVSRQHENLPQELPSIQKKSEP